MIPTSPFPADPAARNFNVYGFHGTRLTMHRIAPQFIEGAIEHYKSKPAVAVIEVVWMEILETVEDYMDLKVSRFLVLTRATPDAPWVTTASKDLDAGCPGVVDDSPELRERFRVLAEEQKAAHAAWLAENDIQIDQIKPKDWKQ